MKIQSIYRAPILLAMAALAIAMLASPTGASAIEPPTFSFAFGEKGTKEGQFESPKGVAIGPEGHVWVTDWTNNRVQEFNAKGEYVSKFGSFGSGNGQLKRPDGIAIDTEGHIWVFDTGNNRIQQFNAKGEYLSQFGSQGSGNGQFASFLSGFGGVALDAKGDIWVVDPGNHRVQEFNSKGEYLGKFGKYGTGNGEFNRPAGIAVDSDGDIWVVDTGNNRIQQFNAKGEYLSQFGTFGAGDGQLKEPSGIAIDSDDSLWVMDRVNARVQGFYPEGAYVTKFGKSGSGEGEFKSGYGIASGAEGRLWVVDLGNYRVHAWKQAAQPAVLTGAATSIKRSEGKLNATINPGGVATSYQFQYGPTPSFGKVAPAAPKAIGSGSSPVKVSETIGGLKAGTTYYYRVVASSEKGSTYGELRYFKTLAAPGPEAAWRIGGKTLTELKIENEAFALQGSHTIEVLSFPLTLDCAETGSGTISGASKLEVQMTLSCKTTAWNGTCSFSPVNLNLSGTNAELKSTSKTFTLKATGCPWGTQEFLVPTFFPEVGSEGVKLPVNSFATGSYGSNPMYYSSLSSWTLTGANSGKEFGIW